MPVSKDHSKIYYERVQTHTTISSIDDKISIKVAVQDENDLTQFVGMRYDGHAEERIHGIGLQPTVWDFKNRTVPIISSEGGIGRGLQPLSGFINNFLQHGGGGNELTTYTASWSYISSRNHHVSFDTEAIGTLAFGVNTEALAWHEKNLTMNLGYGESLKDSVGK